MLSYIEGWYNPTRLQQALGWRSPLEYEAHHHAGHDLAVPATSQHAPVLDGVRENRLDSARSPALNQGSRPAIRQQQPAYPAGPTT